MNEQEVQQAQTIAEIKQRHGWLILTYENETQPGDGLEAHEDRAALLEIVDSQAQKIREQAEKIAINAAYAIELQEKIAEQAKKIKSLNEYIAFRSAGDDDDEVDL